MENLKKESISSIIIVAVNVLMLLIIVAGKHLIDFLSSLGNLFVILTGYIIFSILLYQISRFWKNKIYKIIYNILLFPLTFLYLFVVVAIPVLVTQSFLYVFLGLSFLIPILLYRVDGYFEITSLKYETWVYLILTIGSITATLLNKQVEKLTFKLLPFTARESEKMKRFKLVELCTYISSKNNIKLLIYSLFFFSLIVFNVLNLQTDSYFENKNVDRAILQFFITFIAFERILSNIKTSEFRPSILLDIYKSTFTNELKIISGKKTKEDN